MEGALMVGAVALWLAAVLFFRLSRIWILYYIVGAVGLCLLLVFVGSHFLPWDEMLKKSTVRTVHWAAAGVGVETRIFPGAEDSLMVLVVPQSVGWTMLTLGIESSGLLELAAILGLVAFFPGWSAGRRLYMAVAGVSATFLANVIRILFIVTTLHYMGKDTLFLAHTVLGRAVFFVMVILIYWFAFTLPTLRMTAKRMREDLLR
ncbi:MAG: hypothetical protein V3S20_09090 [Dehalococcoidia bacterium]